MQAVILAGGVGSRLRSLSGGKPKCLVEVGGRPLILHQLETLADHGVGPVLVVLGYQADVVKAAIGERADTVVNEKYEDTNSLYSLWLAREWVKGPFVLLNCDLFFDPDILDLLLEEEGNVLAYDSTSSRGREQTKVAIKQRRLIDIGKDLPAGSARGESLGLLKFDAEGATSMMQIADFLIRDGHEKAWVIEATRAVCQMVPIYGVNVAGSPWTEIDFPYDLDVARREVWPKIWRGRWRQQIYWKRTRWAALAALLTVFALTGWVASEYVGPASVDWETVPPTTGVPVRLERRGRPQRWWSVQVGERAAAVMTGPKAAVEVRLVIPDGAPDSLRYVVELTLDDRVIDWQALTATLDTTAHVDGTRVGDKDRLELSLPAEPHRLGVRLTDGHGSRMLVRLRQPDEP
jgi:choline kinase